MGDDESLLDAETYAYLRRLAQRIHAERAGPTGSLQATGLLHEAWSRLEKSGMRFESRRHFMRTAAKAMRQILVSRTRARMADKRGGGAARTTLSGLGSHQDPVDLLALDSLLDELRDEDPRLAELVVLRVFGGLEFKEIADNLERSESSVYRDWRVARAWLGARLKEG